MTCKNIHFIATHMLLNIYKFQKKYLHKRLIFFIILKIDFLHIFRFRYCAELKIHEIHNILYYFIFHIINLSKNPTVFQCLFAL